MTYYVLYLKTANGRWVRSGNDTTQYRSRKKATAAALFQAKRMKMSYSVRRLVKKTGAENLMTEPRVEAGDRVVRYFRGYIRGRR